MTKKTDIKNYTATLGNDEFYPTPVWLIEKMLDGINWSLVETVLEPSAGKGDIVKAVKEKFKKNYRYEDADIDCIEIDENLQHILRGEGHRVIYDDFLEFNTFKKYNLIVMNPPFSEGDKHLLKAIKMQEKGGNIVCLLNANTIKNPCTNSRIELLNALNKHDASIQYFSDAFKSAERKTGVEVALIKISIPEEELTSDIFESMKKAQNVDDFDESTHTDLALGDYIKAAVAQFNVETASGIDLIKKYRALMPYIMNSFTSEYSYPILELKLDGSLSNFSINKYLRKTRYKYWNALFENPKFTAKLTSNLRSERSSLVAKLREYDFNEYNIRFLMADMNSRLLGSIKETIMEMFNTLTAEHSWYPESKNNVHYFNGWASNSAHKINKKIVLPLNGFTYYNYSKQYDFRTYNVYNKLADIEKCFDYFDGNISRDVDLSRVLDLAQYNPKNIQCKYFKITFYKKGTAHITFTNLDLLEKFNIYAAQNRGWLPPDYGKKKYSDMSNEAKAVIDSFQGKNKYEEIMNNRDYYIVEDKHLLSITAVS